MDKRNQTSRQNFDGEWRPILHPIVPFVYHAMAPIDENSVRMTEPNFETNAHRTTQSNMYFPMGNVCEPNQSGILPSFDPVIQSIVRPTMRDVSGYSHGAIQPTVPLSARPTVPPSARPTVPPSARPTVPPSITPSVSSTIPTSVWPSVQPILHPTIGYVYYNNQNSIKPSYHPGFQTIGFPGMGQIYRQNHAFAVNASETVVNPQYLYTHPMVTSQLNSYDASYSNSVMGQVKNANQTAAVPILNESADFEISIEPEDLDNSALENEEVDMSNAVDEESETVIESDTEFELDRSLNVSSLADSDWSEDMEFERQSLSESDDEFESGSESLTDIEDVHEDNTPETEQEQKASNTNTSKSSAPKDDEQTEKITLTAIGKNFHDEKGFVYSRSNFTKKNSYFRCMHSRKYHCLARVTAFGGNLKKSVLTYEHSHKVEDGNEEELNDIKFTEKLDENCQNSFLLPREIYHNTKLELIKAKEVDPLNVPLQRKKNSYIYRRRKKQIPLLPKTVESFEKMISDPKYKKYYTTDFTDLKFYRGVWKTKSNEKNVAFISETVLEKFNTLQDGKMRADGTFRALPKHMKFCQLFIISIIFRDRSYPLAYILMEKRNFRSYSTVFAQIKSLLKVNVTEIMADYEAATRKAVRKHFPEARLAGCFFHYCQAIRKNAKRFGLSRDKKFFKMIKETSALALLPQNFVAKGFHYIRKQFPNSFRWNRFTLYWQRQWLNANISVYDLVDRTNNYAESFNKSVNTLLKSKNPNIWILIHNLKKIEMDYTAEISKVAEGLMIRKERSAYMTLLDKQIKNATATFIEKKDIALFLENATYDIQLDLYLKERINVNNEVEDDDNANDEDEIIPNDFRKTSNLIEKTTKKKLKRKIEEEQGPQKKRVKLFTSS